MKSKVDKVTSSKIYRRGVVFMEILHKLGLDGRTINARLFDCFMEDTWPDWLLVNSTFDLVIRE